MDKRRSPRYAIKLNALVHPNVGRSWLCTIRDFCEGGMLLVEQDANRHRKLPGISQGQTVGIHFSVPTKGKDQHFRLEGKIIRALDAGVGITFAGGLDNDAMTALLNYSNAQPLTGDPKDRHKRDPKAAAGANGGASPAPAKPASKPLDLKSAEGNTLGISAPQARKIIASVRREVARILPEINSAFFSYMDEQLLNLAKDAKTNAEQSEYFSAMSNIEKAKKDVGQSFVNELLDQIDNPRDLKKLLEERKADEAARKQKQQSRVKLSLVSTDEFEDWLAIANIISRSERIYEKYLQEIRTRMGMLVDSWAHAEANPVGATAFCHAFDSATRKIDLNKEIRQRVYSGFEAKGVPLFRKLYIAVAKLLEESDVFPDLDDDFIVPGSVLKAGASTAEDAAVEEPDEPEKKPEPDVAEAKGATETEDEDDGNDGDDEDDEDAGLRQQIAKLRDQLRIRDSEAEGSAPAPGRPQAPAARRAPSAAGSGKKRAGRGADIGEAISSIYSTVRQLMSKKGGAAAQGFEDDPAAEDVQLDEVHEFLASLGEEVRQTSGRLPIRQRLQESATAGGRQRKIPAKTLESLGVVENLVDTIENDAILSGSAKDWIRQLELTLDKVATTTDDFLNVEQPHGSLEIINQLARLGGSESASVKRNVDDIVNFIAENFDSNPRVFDEALEKLTPLVERQSRAFTGNVQRTVKSSQGQQTLVNAQQAVIEEMNGLLAGQEVPEVLLKLLVPGWRNLMVNTHLRQGGQSADWKKQVGALEQVFHYLGGKRPSPSSPDYVPPDELLAQIEEGLDSIAFEPGQRAPLLASLKRFIVDGEDTATMPMVKFPEEFDTRIKASVARSIGFVDVGVKEDTRREMRESHETDEAWNDWLERVRNLHIGEWLEIKVDKADDLISIIAWISEDHANFVFVNRRGVKTNELVAEDLASRLSDGTAKILESADIPLTDRASHRMLQDMHNQLTHQATHDELTSLINRKEFERQLQRVLALAKRNDSKHVVAYMDLDQFKVINNSAGHDAGDELLVKIAALLRDKLPDVNVTLARLGGDEFGLLIENCERDTGITVVKQLCDAVKQLRFSKGTQSYALTASCGVVVVDKEIESVTRILSGADAACFAAKEAGRDRILVYEADDTVMEHRRGIMAFVSQIDRAISEDRFVLNCQKIEPIDKNSGDHTHYEILLTVLDENDNPLPPQDFIIAAETYNRMGAIDRWVIRNAFRFIASNILKLDRLGAFSINISGNSLTEPDFMEFVLEQFKETRLPTSRVCFEITETSAIGKLDDAIEFMEKLKVIGVQFSLDDFGSGLSSYSYLRSLPVDYLKIDGIFVKDIVNNPNDYAVVKSINEIGHFMGKKTIAEFVENDEILEILREIGVDFAQGYGIERKKPIVELL